MKLPLAMPRLCREPMDHNDPQMIEDRAKPAGTDEALDFGNCRVLLRQRRLLAGGGPVELGARAFELLMVLIEADGALVTKDELQRRVWPDVVVAPENVKTQIAVLRKALGEDRELILTDHGRGYRFIGAIRLATSPEYLPTSGAARGRLPRRQCGRVYFGYKMRRPRRTVSTVQRGRSFGPACQQNANVVTSGTVQG
jgi:DNA-binding winged helix-turn-helix (wHTH) protein